MAPVPVWVDLTRTDLDWDDLDPVDRPGLGTSLGNPIGSDPGPGTDGGEPVCVGQYMASMGTKWPLPGRANGLTQQVRHTLEEIAADVAAWHRWRVCPCVEVAGNGAQRVLDGVGPVPGRVRVRGRSRAGESPTFVLVSSSDSAAGSDHQGILVPVSDVDSGIGCEGLTAVSTMASSIVHVADSDGSATHVARCNGPLHQGTWLPLDQFTMVKRQGPGREFRADGARKPRSVCKACHALIQRQRYGEQRKAYMDTWRAARKASGRVVFKYSQDSSRGADSSLSTKRRARQ